MSLYYDTLSVPNVPILNRLFTLITHSEAARAHVHTTELVGRRAEREWARRECAKGSAMRRCGATRCVPGSRARSKLRMSRSMWVCAAHAHRDVRTVGAVVCICERAKGGEGVQPVHIPACWHCPLLHTQRCMHVPTVPEWYFFFMFGFEWDWTILPFEVDHKMHRQRIARCSCRVCVLPMHTHTHPHFGCDSAELTPLARTGPQPPSNLQAAPWKPWVPSLGEPGGRGGLWFAGRARSIGLQVLSAARRGTRAWSPCHGGPAPMPPLQFRNTALRRTVKIFHAGWNVPPWMRARIPMRTQHSDARMPSLQIDDCELETLMLK